MRRSETTVNYDRNAMNQPQRMQDQPTHEEVARRAYELFLARGGEPGLQEQDWFQAERELRNQNR